MTTPTVFTDPALLVNDKTETIPVLAHASLMFALINIVVVPTGIVQAATIDNNSATETIAKAKVETIVVTGTRLKTPNQQSPSPIITLNSADIAYSGKTSLQEIIMELGALSGSQGIDEANNGENFLNLRNLGTERTLTLVDGHRFVSGSNIGTSAVDTNTIPLAMIDRVEVLTGGASAIYGADAVTGVVNFILKDDFSGLAFDSQYGNALEGDFSDQQYSLTAGHNFADDSANITASYSYGYRPAVLASARAQSSTNLYEQINNITSQSPQFVLANGTNESFFTNGGARIDPFGAFSNGFNGDGSPFVHGVNVGSFTGNGEIGGDGIPNYLLFANGIRPGNERHTFTLKSHYDVAETFKPYISVNYADVATQIINQHSLTVGSRVARDNAFLPAAVLAAAGPDTTSIMFNRWDLDSGLNQRDANKQTYQILLGAKGQLSAQWRYDISANYGQSKRHQTVQNNRLFDRYIAAIDAIDVGNGQIVCRSDIDPASFNNLPGDFLTTRYSSSQGAITFTPGVNSGCVPFNPLIIDNSTDNNVNQAAIDWIWQPTTNNSKNSQKIISAHLTGLIDEPLNFMTLSGGPIGVVLGGEYREEKVANHFNGYANQPVADHSGSDLSGRFDVTEVFTELSLPLLESLTVDGAYRYSDYSTIGSTDTWKLGTLWQPIDSLSLRGTLSSAVRAPNIGELFKPQTSTSTALAEDPCHIDNIHSGSSTRAVNCAQQLSALGVDPTTFAPVLGTFFPGLTGGSPNLTEETSKTRTLGFIWQPANIQGLQLSVDHFDIEITDAVITPRQTAIFNACYDADSLDNVFCDLIGRDTTTGAANYIELQSVNVARIESSGVEFSAVYQFASSHYGAFKISLNGTYLDELNLQKTAQPTLTDDKGLFNTDSGGSSPEWVSNLVVNWQYDDWDVNYRFNYQSSTLRSPLTNAQRATASDITDSPFVKAFINHDLQVGYFYDGSSRFYLGIRNLGNEYPDKTRGSLNSFSGRQSYAGRTFYVGLNMQFDDLWD